jgi:hypothetical protein
MGRCRLLQTQDKSGSEANAWWSGVCFGTVLMIVCDIRMKDREI